MSPTRKTPNRTAGITAKSARSLANESERLISRITDSLDAAQTNLEKLPGSVGAGVDDLRRNLSKLLRDARRDAARIGKSTRAELERLQKEVTSAAKSAPGAGRASKAVSRTKAKPAKAKAAKATAKATKATRAKAAKAKPAKAKARKATAAKASSAKAVTKAKTTKAARKAKPAKPKAAGARS